MGETNNLMDEISIWGILFWIVVIVVPILLVARQTQMENRALARYAERLRQKEMKKKGKSKAQQIYNEEFLAIRTDVLKRDNYTCVNCGQTGTELHVHHIVPRAEGGTNDLTNLVTLCSRCHSVQDAKGHELIQEDEIEEDTAFGMPIDMLEEEG